MEAGVINAVGMVWCNLRQNLKSSCTTSNLISKMSMTDKEMWFSSIIPWSFSLISVFFPVCVCAHVCVSRWGCRSPHFATFFCVTPYACLTIVLYQSTCKLPHLNVCILFWKSLQPSGFIKVTTYLNLYVCSFGLLFSTFLHLNYSFPVTVYHTIPLSH